MFSCLACEHTSAILGVSGQTEPLPDDTKLVGHGIALGHFLLIFLVRK